MKHTEELKTVMGMEESPGARAELRALQLSATLPFGVVYCPVVCPLHCS